MPTQPISDLSPFRPTLPTAQRTNSDALMQVARDLVAQFACGGIAGLPRVAQFRTEFIDLSEQRCSLIAQICSLGLESTYLCLQRLGFGRQRIFEAVEQLGDAPRGLVDGRTSADRPSFE